MVKVREESVWSMDFVYAGETYSFSWNKGYDSKSGDFLGAWAKTVKQGSENERISEDIRVSLLKAASVFRVMEITAEISLKDFYMIDNEKILNLIVELAERSWRGEYLGQMSGNNNLYVQDIAEIFDITMSHAVSLVDKVNAEGKVGMSGYILIPYSFEEASKKNLYESTGHRSLSFSDFGYWACSYCLTSGDDTSSPSDFSCEQAVGG